MAGAGSRTAARFIYSIAPKDGTAIGTVDQATPLEQALGDPSVKFDSRDWTGSATRMPTTTCLPPGTRNVKTIEDATKIEIAIGATGPTRPRSIRPR